MTTFLTFLSGLHFFGSERKEGQAELRCPNWRQQRQRPFLIQCSRSCGVILVTHMYDINIHGVGVFSRFRWRGGMVVGLFGGVVPTGSGSEQLLHTKQ